jgi:hypothetical protein
LHWRFGEGEGTLLKKITVAKATILRHTVAVKPFATAQELAGKNNCL